MYNPFILFAMWPAAVNKILGEPPMVPGRVTGDFAYAAGVSYGE
jgi:hypothetical protein